MFLVYFIYTGYQEGDEDLVFEVIDGVNQIRQPQPHDINIYPNPANSEFTLEAESGDLVVVRDVSGRFVWSGVMNSDINQISTSGWTSGPYTVEVSQNNHRIIRQIIIE